MARLIGTGTTVVRRSEEKIEAGGWLSSPSVRKRKGLFPGSASHVNAPGLGARYVRPDRFLTDEELWQVYRRTPDVRASIDSIVRRVATFDWNVVPVVDPKSEYYVEAAEIASRAQRFLAAPNQNGDTWQEVFTAILTDLLVFDAGALELVSGSDGQLKELVPLRGSTIRPVYDEHGKLLFYQQDVFGDSATTVVGGGEDNPKFSPKELVYLRAFSNTGNAGYGNPLIESLINEVITLIRGSEHIMLAYDADEIPPGILVLTGIAGNAAREARADFQNFRGQDNKIRVLTTADPTGAGARWVELRHTPKDLEYESIIDSIRRSVWRVFGVLPVEMGASESMPRATAQVQMDVAQSHLVTPLLELIQAKINTRVLPLVVGDSELAQLVQFEFDRGTRPNAEESKALADRYQTLIGVGVMTRNEVRKEMGFLPIIGGDVPTVDTAQGPVPLDALIQEGPVGALVIEPPQVTPDSGAISGGAAQDEDDAPGEVTTKSLPLNERAVFADLPSDWQPNGRFAGYRTLPLAALAELVSRYYENVRPFWQEAQSDAMAVVGAYYKNGRISPSELPVVQSKMSSIVDKLGIQWALAVEPIYVAVGMLARDAATDFCGVPVLDNWKIRSELFAQEAIGYLVDPMGMLGVIKTKLSLTVDALSLDIRTKPKPPKVKAPKGAKPGIETEEAVSIVGRVFEANETRINNWSGKSVQLANQMLADGMMEGSQAEGENERVDWWFEWVSVSDDRTCPTCVDEGGLGFRRLANMSVAPGGDTQCGARCRCVIVLWTEKEINEGSAIELGTIS